MPDFPSSYTVDIELNILEQKRTMELTEYFNYQQNMGKLKIFSDGFITNLIYDYAIDELLTISDDLSKYVFSFAFV